MEGELGMRGRDISWRGSARIILLVIFVLATAGVHGASANPGQDNYPDFLKQPAKDAVVDSWGFYNRECTSFVAWRLSHEEGNPGFRNSAGGRVYGNANTWADTARALGIPVDATPAVGAVVWFPANTGGAGSLGHVAMVLSISGGTVQVEDYNWANTGQYLQHTVTYAGTGIRFIHFGQHTNRNLPASVSTNCPGQQWFTDRDTHNTPIGRTFSNGSTFCVRVSFTPVVTAAACDFWFYVPSSHATASITFGYWNAAGTKFYAPLNEAPVEGYVKVFRAANVRAINFQDNNGQPVGATEIGWGTHADFGMQQVC